MSTTTQVDALATRVAEEFNDRLNGASLIVLSAGASSAGLPNGTVIVRTP